MWFDGIGKSYKFRIYPNTKQQKQIDIIFSHCRFVYNYFLAQRIAVYKETGKSVSRYEQGRELTKMRNAEETKWLAEADRSAYKKFINKILAVVEEIHCKDFTLPR